MGFRYDVFLSHSSADKPAVEFLARKLEAAEITPFLDKWNLIPGEPWQEALEDALDGSRTCAVFVGPKGIGPWQNEEMRSALEDRVRDKAFRVIPVLLPGSLESHKEKLPRFLRRLTWVDFRDGLEDEDAFHRLVSGIWGMAPGSGGSGGGESVKHPRTTPYRCMVQRPEGYVLRQEYEKVIETLLSGNQDSLSVGITTALQGAGGFGKTFLAQEICFDGRVRERFPDGILWATMGEDITPEGRLSRIRDLIRWWTDKEAPAFETVTAAGAKLRELIAASRVLVVVDDVWNSADVIPFKGLGNDSALLITTRDRQTLPSGSINILVDAMVSRDAVQLLRSGLPNGSDGDFEKLAAELGEWPLLLSLVNRQLRELVKEGMDLGRAFKGAREALSSQGFSAFDRDDPESRHATASKAILVSVQRLPNDKARDLYFRLAVFPEDVNVPLSVLQRLWEIDGFQVRKLCRRLFELSLLRDCDPLQEAIRLHDVVRKVLVEQSEDSLVELHRRLLESFRLLSEDWWEVNCNENYFWQYLAYHFIEAGWSFQLRELLLYFPFIEAKLKVMGVDSLIGDYLPFSGALELRQVQVALQESSPVVRKDPKQLAGQLWGRLLEVEGEGIRKLLLSAQAVQTTSWIRPRRTCLSTSLFRYPRGHSDRVTAVLVVDSRRAVSSSRDGTLRVWDLDSGETLHVLQGHSDRINSVAVVDSRRVVSASDDGTLRVWDLDSGQPLHLLQGHTGWVEAILVDGLRAISTSKDKTLRVWDLNIGEALHVFQGHSGEINSVVVVDSRLVVSASRDRTLRVWDLNSGQTLHVLQGHSDEINRVAVVDSRRAISASNDKTLRVWDLDSGQTLHILEGHTAQVNSVAVVDSRRAVSTSHDGTPRVWDLNSGQTLLTPTFKDHRGGVYSALPMDNHRIVSAVGWTLQVWDLGSGQNLHTIKDHTGPVSLALVADSCRVVTYSDRALRLWDLNSGEGMSLTLHAPVWGFAYSAERRILVAGDRTGEVHFFDLVEPE